MARRFIPPFPAVMALTYTLWAALSSRCVGGRNGLNADAIVSGRPPCRAYSLRRDMLHPPLRTIAAPAAACPRWRYAFLVVPMLALAMPAAAHSELQRSLPAAGAVFDQSPERIELYFYERVRVTALRLRRVDGDEVPLPRRTIREGRSETVALPQLAPGEYRAEWRIISADGHAAGGVIPFRINALNRP